LTVFLVRAALVSPSLQLNPTLGPSITLLEMLVRQILVWYSAPVADLS